ncbi:MAG: tRNA (adenosine(37)-N6)-threonylcarbamoyltransferase complex dimerization subunit type 1 TsaB [Phycisphaerales bacterium]|nr:tRNA (adenosine(37)-N6)-threonylcarbamoyltransferase complex dimerization subunit type 1 TsaB [Phycisphaerales bacterium]
MRWMLAIETSQREGELAIKCSAGEVHTAQLTSASGIDDQLMPHLDALARSAGCTPETLTCVGVSMGPGGFTGLRIASATAQMLAESTGCSLVAVPSALACVQASGMTEGKIAVALASKGDSTWLSIVDAASMTLMSTAGLVDAQAAAPQLEGCALVLADVHLPGPITSLFKAIGCPCAPPTWSAQACLALTEREFAAGRTVPAEAMVPLYPRVPEAVTLFAARSKPT